MLICNLSSPTSPQSTVIQRSFPLHVVLSAVKQTLQGCRWQMFHGFWEISCPKTAWEKIQARERGSIGASRWKETASQALIVEPQIALLLGKLCAYPKWEFGLSSIILAIGCITVKQGILAPSSSSPYLWWLLLYVRTFNEWLNCGKFKGYNVPAGRSSQNRHQLLRPMMIPYQLAHSTRSYQP